jgi:biotin--protein ligase
MNILVYSDLGASPNSIKHTYNTLASILGHVYDIIQIDRKVLQSEPWEVGCVMLAMPGGRDMPYCEALNGEPNKRIQKFIHDGGRYLGLCAGAYYASTSIEFEKGRTLMEIIQPRELSLYPGISRGTVYPGFVYNSESGARSVTVTLEREALVEYYGNDSLLPPPEEIKMYYNGGGYFVHPERYDNVTVLCRYKDPSGLCDTEDEPKGPAAVVHCTVGAGHALLIGTHPEYDITSEDLLLVDQHVSKPVKTILSDLILSEMERKRFLRAAFARIGLNVVPVQDNIVQENKVPQVTPLYLTGLTKEWVHKPVSYLLRKSDPVTHLMEDQHDVFHISALGTTMSEQAQLLSLCRAREDKPALIELVYQPTINAAEPIYPHRSLTPYFHFEEYYKHLIQKRSLQWGGGAWLSFGSALMYAEVIGSTQSIMDK